MWWAWMAAAQGAEPPAELVDIARNNPGLTLVVADANDVGQASGWADLVLAMPPDREPDVLLERLGAAGCVVLGRRDGDGWAFEPSDRCTVAPSTSPPEVARPPDPETTTVGPAAPSPVDAQDDASAEPIGRAPQRGIQGDELLITFGAAYGAYVGAETAWLIGEALESDESAHTTQGIAPGLLGGGAIGLTTAYLLATATDTGPAAHSLLYAASGHGLFYGVQIGRALIGPQAPGRAERVHAAGLAGSMLGLGLGTALSQHARPPGDQARFSIATGVGWVAASGINDLAGLGVLREDRDGDGIPENTVWDARPRAALTIGSAAVFSGLGALANRASARPGVASLALSLGHGAWLGGWSPLLIEDNPRAGQITGGLRLGLGVGYGGALLMSALGEPSGRSVGLQLAGWSAGSALGAGIPLAMGRDGPARGVVGPMLAGGVGGQILGAVLAPHYALEADDAVLLGTLSAWTTYQAIGWGTYASYTTRDARRPFGYGLSAGGAGVLVTLGLTPLIDVEPSGSVMLLSSGGWGTWYGAWASQLADLNPSSGWLVTLGAGNGALLATGVAEAAGFRPTWSDVALIDGLGLVGAAVGGLAGVIFLYDPDNPDPLVISAMAGSTLGLTAGAILAAHTDGEGAPQVGGLGASGWKASVSATPLPGRNGSTGAMVRLDLREVGR